MLPQEKYTFSAPVKKFEGLAGWHYVRVPSELGAAAKKSSLLVNRGLIPIQASINNTIWQTSLLPFGDGTLFIALKASVRKTEMISSGDTITISFSLVER